MKKQIIFLFLILVLQTEISIAQSDFPKNSMNLKSVFINYQAPNRDNEKLFTDLDFGIEIGYNRHFNKLFSLSIPLRLAAVGFPVYDENLRTVTGYRSSKAYAGLDALLNLHFWQESCVSPFVYAGIGGALQDFDSFHGQVPMGLGLDLRINDMTSLVAHSDYRFGFEDGYDNWQHAIGLRIYLGSNDRDKDGVPDKDDECPDDWGTINGCPDTDGDGIRDLDDRCPKEAGVIENQGCPSDRDKDGVYDNDDECPDVAGTLRGCPDKDKDGVPDKDDKCPDVPGPVSNMGCPPDRDNDGFPDSLDPCPDVAGTFNGCPDSDDDGIPDNLDKCPNTKGTAANFGCPEIKVEDKKVLDIAMKYVNFKSGTSEMTTSSRKNLDEVLKVLLKYPEMNLSIEGHTDDVGDDAFNQSLSEKRARACMDYLIQKGISKDRLLVTGYGETKPIGDNKTEEGRLQNRRTEFNPIWR
jgi:OmpA-OmpF porin, OOP family